MFSDINSESTRRLTEAKSLLNLIKQEDTLQQFSFDPKIHKGVFFVLLYGALEYTLTASVQRCIVEINNRNYKIQLIKPALYSLIFNKECDAIMDARDKKWTKRHDLFSQVKSDKICCIEDNLFPTGTGNIKYKQIDSIWKTFGISSLPIPRLDLKSRLSDLADNRNKIAHGRELSAMVGGNYTVSEIEIIYNCISEYCSYITISFEDYINNEGCLIQ